MNFLKLRGLVAFPLTALFVILSIPAMAQTGDNPLATARLFEEAAQSREEAAIIWENLGRRVKAAQIWAESAESWRKAANAYQTAGAASQADAAWARFKKAIDRRDRAEVVVTVVTGGDQSLQVGGVSEPVRVKITDKTGVPIPGIEVSFEISGQPSPEAGARIVGAVAHSDSDGVASASLKAGREAGPYTLTVHVANLSLDPEVVSFDVSAAPSARLEVISGNNQVVRVNQRALAPLVVRVTDIHGNPVPGVPVRYRIVSEPEGATGHGLSSEETATDAAGAAGVRFQAGHLGGNYVVLVESGDLEGSPSKFDIIVRQTIPTIKIVDVVIEGTSDVERLLERSSITPGQTYLLPELGRLYRNELKRLYETGRFSSVVGYIDERSGDEAVAIFTVQERPQISNITIDGTKKIKEADLRGVLGISEGSHYSIPAVERSKKAILQYLEREGFLNASVSYETALVSAKDKDDQVALTFHITEADKIKVAKMNLNGNDFFSDWSLNWHMKTGSGRVYNEAEFQADRQKILSRYYDRGFLSAQMNDPVVRFDERGRMILDIVIEEGPQYHIGEIEITGNTAVSDQELLALIRPEPGEIFRSSRFFQSVEQIRLAIARQGHAEARVVPEETLHFDSGIVDFNIRVIEGAVLVLEGIEVEGNLKTQDRVILRELHFNTGDVLNGDEIDKAKRRLERLGFFEPGSVRMILSPGSSPEKRILTVKVTEGKTGQIQFGGGFSSADGLVAFLSLEKKNFDPSDFFSFTGAGQEITLTGEFGGTKNSFSLSFTEPYFRNRPLAVGFDVFNVFSEREGYDWRRVGGALRAGHPWGEFGRLSYKYEFEKIEVLDVTTFAPSDIQIEAGFPASNTFERTTAGVTTGFVHDTRDERSFPTTGHVVDISHELAGTFFGGNVSFSRPELSYSRFIPLFNKKHVLAFRTSYGTLSNFFDNNTPIPSIEKYFLGGSNTVRGYGERSIQIFDPNGSPTGPGNSFALGNVEYRVPFLEDKSISAVLFFDVGGVFAGEFAFEPGDLKYGTGAGVRMNTPLGLIRLDYGFGLSFPNKNTGILHFSIGQTF